MRQCLIIKSLAINYDFNKNIYIFVPNLVENVFSEIGSLFQNSWPFYDRTSWLSVSHPFFSHGILSSGRCSPEDSGC